MRPITVIAVAAMLGFCAKGCSNDSGPTGHEALPVELSVWVVAPFQRVQATVHIANLSAVTDTDGVAVFHTDINTLMSNNTYPLVVSAPGFVQAFPQTDSLKIPSQPNTSSGYSLETTVQMKPGGQ